MKHKSSQSAACSAESSAKPSVRRWGVSMVAWALVLSMCAGLVFPAYAAENEPEPTETTAATGTTEAADSTETTGASNVTEVTESAQSTEADGLTPEEQAQAEAVLTALNALESAGQVEANLAALEEDPEGYAAYYHQALAATQAVRDAYTALSVAQKELVGDITKLNDLDWLVAREFLPDDDNQGEIRDYLAGDWAYISNLVMQADPNTTSGKAVYTGSGKWDADDEAGNDSSALNSIVRTYDTVQYNFLFYTDLREEVRKENCGGIHSGRVFFEFVLPYSEQESMFDVGSMLWLSNSSYNAQYRQTTVEVDGVKFPVLRGSFILEPAGSNESAIGASENELFIVTRVLRMKNGDTFAPIISLWLEHNDVGATYSDNGTIPASPVWNQPQKPEDLATMTPPEVTVSARLMFNLAVTGVDSRNTATGRYDFNEPFEDDTINAGLGEVEGRLNGYGLQLELRGKAGQGMRGMELPKKGDSISFTINLSTEFDPLGDLPRASEPDYLPLFWSGGGNTKDVEPTQRPINAPTRHSVDVPFNQYSDRYFYTSCQNGGTWSFTQGEDKSRIQVTVTGFEFDGSQIPYTFPAYDSTIHTYYDPDKVQDRYWEIERAIFSGGELWLLQPYTAVTGDNKHITEKYNTEGMFYAQVKAVDVLLNGTVAETSESDNLINDGQYLSLPGQINTLVLYMQGETRNWNAPLVAGCWNYDKDYAPLGGDVTLMAGIQHNKAEGKFAGAGYDLLIKFDDEFFIPDNDGNNYYISATGTLSRKLLWAALPEENTGWDSDEHMKQATVDDLVYYTSLDALYAANKVPVAVLVEFRGAAPNGGMNHIFVFVDGTVNSECTPNQTYMITQNSYGWSKQDVAADVLAYYMAQEPDKYKSVNDLTDDNYIHYMKNMFPSRADPAVKMFPDGTTTVAGDYPKCFYRQDYYYTSQLVPVSPDGTLPPNRVSALEAAKKATYPNGVYTPGSGSPYYQDTCLAVSYVATIKKEVPQVETTTQANKVSYDVSRNQRTVVYRLNAGIQRPAGGPATDEVLYIEDILPASLTFNGEFVYLGGEYTQDPLHQEAGSCTGTRFFDASSVNVTEPTDEHPCLVEVTKQPDGTTRVLFKIKVHLKDGQTYYGQPIYYSCSIGTPGVDETDVTNGLSITNTVSIWATRDNLRERTADNGNAHSHSITILKTTASSLSKISNRLVAELNDELSFTMNVGNNSNTGKTSLIVETLPFREMDGTKFNGPLTVSSFHEATVDSDSQPTDNNFVFYYTTEPDYAGLRSADISALAQAQGISLATWLESSGHWHPLTFESTTETVNNMTLYPAGNLPEVSGNYEDGTPRQITSIVALGELKPNTTMKMHISLGLDKGQPGDYLVNFLSQESLSCYARTQIVKRSLSGLCWLDSDKDGIQDDGEAMLSGINVTLVRLEGASYVPVCYPGTQTPITIQTGQLISVNAASNNEAEAYGEGLYKFTELPAGTYGVIFESGDTSINDYTASPVGAGTNTEADSDGIPTYSGATLLNTQITGIVMEPAASLSYGVQDSRHHDSGFYPTAHYELPLTGGVGTGLFIIPGFLLTTGAALGLRRKKNKR